MLSIGEMSRACSVTVKTLRHYEKIGLVAPTKVDEWTGYRYYDESLIPTMLLIQRLKRYGFTLVEIGRMLPEMDDAPKMQTMLQHQRSVLAARIDQANLVLRDMDVYLNSFERTGDMMAYQKNYEITLKQAPERLIFSIRRQMSVNDFGRYYGELYEKVNKEHIAISGQSLAIYYDAEFHPEDTDVELALIVTDARQATRTLPGGLMATTVHRGPYSSLDDAYGMLTQWIAENGYEMTGAPYEIYRITGFDKVPPSEWETDIYFPVQKKA